MGRVVYFFKPSLQGNDMLSHYQEVKRTFARMDLDFAEFSPQDEEEDRVLEVIEQISRDDGVRTEAVRCQFIFTPEGDFLEYRLKKIE